MTIDAHANFALTTLATAPSGTSGTSCAVAPGTGSRFPTVPFNATIWPSGVNPTTANAEIVRVTARSTDDLTITRAQEGTSARTHATGYQISATITKKTLTDAEYGAHGYVNIKDPQYGAVGDGSTDDTTAIQAALNVGGVVVFPASTTTYRVRSKLTITQPVTILAYGATVLFDFPVGTSNANGGLFNITANDVSILGLTIDATGITGTITSVNRYAIRVDPSDTTRYSHLTIRDCRFTNLTQYSGTIPATSTVMHGVYARQVDDLLVDRCVFNTLSGAGVFLVDTERAKVTNCDLIKHGWSGVWLNNANKNAVIHGNTFSGTTAGNPSWYGGAIDVMGQTSDSSLPGEPDENVSIIGNHFVGGVFGYGTVVRLSSVQGAVVADNTFDQCNADSHTTAGSGGAGSHNHYIECTVRDVTQDQGPHRNIVIANNRFIPKGTGWQIPIYAITTSGTNTNTDPCDALIITGNQALAVDASNYFQSFFVLHGFGAGYTGINVTNNIVDIDPYSVANYQPAGLPGAVVLICNAGASVARAIVSGNIFRQVNGAGVGNNDTAVNIYSDVTDVQVFGNTFINFYRDITVDAGNAGTVPILSNLHNRAAGGTSWAWRGTMFSPVDGTYDLLDGVSAPGTVSGLARLYVDTSDGDLKVKFGDGTVKTIVVDT